MENLHICVESFWQTFSTDTFSYRLHVLIHTLILFAWKTYSSWVRSSDKLLLNMSTISCLWSQTNEKRNLPIFTYMQTAQVSTCLKYQLSAVGKFLCLHMFFYRTQHACVHLKTLQANTDNLCFIPLLCQRDELESHYIEKSVNYSDAQWHFLVSMP